MNPIHARCIVVPVDFSKESLEAVNSALALSEAGGGEVRVVHVLPELNVTEPGVIWDAVDNENRAKHAREALQEELGERAGKLRDIDIEFGDPGHKIPEYCQRVGADLIITPSHGRTGLKRLLIGSVAERVVRHAHCPVLVLRS